MSATSVSDLTDDELRSAKFQLPFAPVEKVINKRFLDKYCTEIFLYKRYVLCTDVMFSFH